MGVLMALAVLPIGAGLIGTDLNIGVLYLVALGSLGIMAALMAGWGSNNKYALLGGLRSSAQMVSYEIAMGMSTIPVLLLAGNVSLSAIVAQQAHMGWNVLSLTVAWLTFLVAAFAISGIAETARSPFDLLEAESEIVAGFHVEYSGMKFALFFLGEYVNALAVSFMFATLFLGGYNGPLFPPYIWLLIKAAVVFTILMWLRGTLPRIRVDQMHTMNWKFFVPISAVNLIIVLLVAKIFQPGNPAMPWVTPAVQAMATAITTLIPFLIGLSVASRNMRRRRDEVEALAESRREANRAAAASMGGAH